jgi:hypothetical protein
MEVLSDQRVGIASLFLATEIAGSAPLRAPGRTPALRDGLGRFEALGLADMSMAGAALMDRVETKFILREDELQKVLVGLTHSYRVLEIDGRRLNRYRTVYFDTPDLALYHTHHAGALNRYKIRSREYQDSGVSFVEVKLKTNKRRMVKTRLQTNHLVTRLDLGTGEFVGQHSPYAPDELAAQLANRYARATLVRNGGGERVTVDVGLQLATALGSVHLSELAVVEVKQHHYMPSSPLFAAMRAHGIQPTRFSKYCVGIALLCPGVKSNAFRPLLRQVERIIEEGNGDGRTH